MGGERSLRAQGVVILAILRMKVGGLGNRGCGGSWLGYGCGHNKGTIGSSLAILKRFLAFWESKGEFAELPFR